MANLVIFISCNALTVCVITFPQPIDSSASGNLVMVAIVFLFGVMVYNYVLLDSRAIQRT